LPSEYTALFGDAIDKEVVKLDELHVKVLIYADDTVISAETLEIIQIMLEFCRKWGLKINAEK